jgi:DNA-binding winged helix-turn-helix (wHTH) protein/tetratricopeptide (TPR) repeat protein
MTPNDLPSARELYEFGRFRVDPDKQLLLRGEEPVALTPKAFQILLVLIRHGQTVVTKDDLLKAVWPDTFVEEGNLSRNVFMLRKALGDAPHDRFIVTVPGKGYRFAEQVRVVFAGESSAAPGSYHDDAADDRDQRGATPSSHEASSHNVPTTEIMVATHTRAQVDVNVHRQTIWPVVAVALVLAMAVGVVAIRWRHGASVALTDKNTVVLAAFSNSTGDPVFDETLRQGIAVQLEQSPFLSLVSDQRIRHMLQLMQQPADVPLTGDVAREACERAGAAAFLEGSIASLGSQYVVGLKARDCRSGAILDDEQARAGRKEDVLQAVSTMVGTFRSRVGESFASVQQHSTRLDEATTPSLEALRAYSAGWDALAARGASASLPFFQRAIDIDPGFAMAHAWLGRAYADLDQSDRAAASLQHAWDLRDRTSESERYFVTTTYQTLVLGNIEAARQTGEAWARAYPRDARAKSLLAGMISKTAGRFEEAVAQAKHTVDADPDFAIGYYSLGVNNQYLGRLEDAERALTAAAARGLDIDEFVMLAYELAFLEGDPARLEREAARARSRPAGENWMAAREGFVAAYAGHLRAARILSDRAVAQARQAGQPERAGLWEAGAAVREALFGETNVAQQRARAALELSHDRETEYGAALAYVMGAETVRTQALIDDLQQRFPEDSSVQFSFLPVLRALIALDRHEPERALESLQVASPHELGVPRSTLSALFGALYPVYLRGNAYLALGRAADAEAEFRTIINHRTIVASDPIGALSHLQLARAFAASGDNRKAKAAYEDFFTLWKGADPDIPIFNQAKAEYAKLR